MTTACGLNYFMKDFGNEEFGMTVYRSVDNFATYDIVYAPPPGTRYTRGMAICADASNPTNWVIGGCRALNPETYGALIHYSADDGLTWNASNYKGGRGITSIATDNLGLWMAATDSFDRFKTGFPRDINVPAQILKSVDNGATWTVARTFTDETTTRLWYGDVPWPWRYSSVLRNSLATDGAGTWIVALNVDIFRSTDNGDTWVKVYTHPGETALDEHPEHSQGMATDGNGVWLTTVVNDTTSTIVRSTDNGATWAPAYVFPYSGFIYDTYYGVVSTDKHGDWILVARYRASEEDYLVYRSSDNGTHWTPVYNPPVIAPENFHGAAASPYRHWLVWDCAVSGSSDYGHSFSMVFDYIGQMIVSLAYSALNECPLGVIKVGPGVEVGPLPGYEIIPIGGT